MVSVCIGVGVICLSNYDNMYYLQYGGRLGTFDLSVDCCVYLPVQKRSVVVLQYDTVVRRHDFSKQGHCLLIACYIRLLACVIANSTMCMWEVSQPHCRA